MPSPASHRALARVLGREAAQRANIPQGGTDDDVYLLARRDQAIANNWTAEANRCFFCGKKAWRTGYLPTIQHPMAYCKKHITAYATIRDRKPTAAQVSEARRATLRIHMRAPGAFDLTLCGIEPDGAPPKLATNWIFVDCERCLQKRVTAPKP